MPSNHPCFVVLLFRNYGRFLFKKVLITLFKRKQKIGSQSEELDLNKICWLTVDIFEL